MEISNSLQLLTAVLTCCVILQQSLAQTSAPYTNSTSDSTTLSLSASSEVCQDPTWVCGTKGVDFHDGGSYFQNVNSTDDFTFTSEYYGCEDDVAFNILVDPNAQQYLCSVTNLSYNDTLVTSVCPIEKEDLYTGEWSVLIISNNGGCAPVAYQRNFFLSVGIQQTTTVTPYIIFTSTSTPISSFTITTTATTLLALPTTTITSQKSLRKPTITVTPRTSFTTTTTTLSTHTLTRYNLQVMQTYITRIAKCTPSPTQKSADPTISMPISVTVTGNAATTLALGNNAAAITSAAIVSSAAAPAIRGLTLEEEMAWENFEFLEHRAEVLHHAPLKKRAPDSATVTIIQTDPNSFIISTSTITAPVVSTTSTSFVTSTSTSSPAPVTLYLNSVTTITLPTPTGTRTRTIKMTTTWVTATRFVSTKIPITKTPSAAASSCTAHGGYMH